MFSTKLMYLAALFPGLILVDSAFAEPVTSSSVVSIEGKVVNADEITSFGIQIEQFEGRMLATQEDLLNEFIFTRLYDKIPTTATIPEMPAPDAGQLSVAQRTILKREFQKEVSAGVEAPRSLMEEWYQKNAGRYTQPERVHAYHLFMETSNDNASSSPEKVRSRLTELKESIDKGTSFSKAAEEYSEAASGEAGGEIGKIRRAQPIGPLTKPMNIELENAFFALPVGKVSNILETRHGMHLLYVTEKETTHTPSIDDLVSSGILPGAVTQDLITSTIRNLIADTVAKHNGSVALTDKGDLTTDSVVFKFDGRDHTVGDLGEIYGPRFTAYIETIKGDLDKIEELKQQALEDEALVQAAVDKGIGERTDIKEQLDFMSRRSKAGARIEAILNAEAKVDDEKVRLRYEGLKDQMRQAEAEGTVILFKPQQTTDTAEQARSLDRARKKAEEVHAQLEKGEFEAVIESLKKLKDPEVEITVSEVTRHVIGQTTDSIGRMFDQGITRIQGDVGLSQVVPSGTTFIISRLEKRHPGEPMPLDTVRSRVESMVRHESETEIRKGFMKRLEEKDLIKFLPGAEAFRSRDEANQ